MIAYNVQYDVMDFILHLFMLQTYVFTGDKIIILNGVLWFVADIMFFYLISPFLYSLLKNQSIKIILIILTLIIGIQSLYPSICKSIGIYVALIYIPIKVLIDATEYKKIRILVLTILEILSLILIGYSFYKIRRNIQSPVYNKCNCCFCLGISRR